MIRVARERIVALFALAEVEAQRGPGPLPTRYVQLARRIGMRYNVRLPTSLRSFYCRSCSVFWVEGRTVRTRFRGGHRTRTCLACGDVRRVLLHPAPGGSPGEESPSPGPASAEDPVLVGADDEGPLEEGEDEEG